jgi:DNA-binding Lrp family transcriptional regulator
MEKSSMNELGRQFINWYQGGFPLNEQPYATVASRLGTDETTLLATLTELLNSGILSRFGPLYDASSIGGGLTLAAMSVPEQDFNVVAEQVNSLPEVAHNYRREHELNMWFVIATETPEILDRALSRIESLTARRVYNFPKLQTFYLGLRLSIDEQARVTTVPIENSVSKSIQIIEALDRAIIQATQGGLALQSNPYADIAQQCDCKTTTVIDRMQVMLGNGVIRRIGAVPNHYRLGLQGNGMSVWDVPDERLAEMGGVIGKLDFVSHCYERPRHLPLWPYNLYAMVHGHDRAEVSRKVDRIAVLLGDSCRRYEVLFSSAILKKSGLRLVA